jgi:hypothetical protein
VRHPIREEPIDGSGIAVSVRGVRHPRAITWEEVLILVRFVNRPHHRLVREAARERFETPNIVFLAEMEQHPAVSDFQMDTPSHKDGPRVAVD